MATVSIGTSTYDMQEKLLSVASNYFNITDMNVFKVGLFGYITESMALIARDGVFHRDTLYNELFLNTANIPKSIYNWAKIYNYNIANATPAKMSVYFSIKKQDVIDYAVTSPNNLVNISDDVKSSISSAASGSKIFLINNNDPFYLSNYKYRLEYPVLITCKNIANSDDYSITAQYILPNSSDNYKALETLDTPYIRTWIETVDGEKYIYLILKIWQMEKTTTTYTTYSVDVSDSLIHEIAYADQIAAFNVYYNGTKIASYFDSAYIPDESKYCYYAFPDDNIMQIYFSGMSGAFRPAFNSKIKVEILTTKGATCNFTYTGDILFKFTDPNLTSLSTTIVSITDSKGGKNKPTLTEIKKTLIENVLVRDNLITETDLNLFFNSIINSDSINNSKIEFIKKRDDILKRLYSAYLLMRNKNGYIIPSNTVNLYTDLSFVEGKDFAIPAGTIVIYDSILKKYRFLQDNEYPEDFIDSDGIIMYSIPFHIAIRMSPFPRMIYYQNTIDESIALSYQYVNPAINNEFIISKVDIYRNSITENEYTFSLSLNTNLSKLHIIDNLIIRAVLIKDEKNYGYFDFVLNDSEDYSYISVLKTDDTFNSSGLFNITNSLHDMDTGEIIPNCYIDEGCSLKLSILYNGSSDKTKGDTAFSALGMSDISNYTTAVIFSNDSDINLFKCMSNIMSSELVISTSGIFALNSVPVISSTYFSSEDNYKDLYSILSGYENVLIDNFDKLENNTSIDLKFYNTYGICQYSSIDTTNLKLVFKIKLTGTYSSDIATTIKKSIVEFIEKANDNNSGLISISNIITELETNFDNIKYIEFVSLNGVNQQKIQYLYPDFSSLTSEQIINYVPEFINVSMRNLEDTDNVLYTPDIEITFI